jgi:Amidase
MNAVNLKFVYGDGIIILYYRLSSSKRMQKIFWHNAGFHKVRKLDGLSEYLPRFDPSVYITPESATLAYGEAPNCLRVKKNTSFYTATDFHELYVSKILTPIAVVNALLPLIRRDMEPIGKHAVAFLESKASAIQAAARLSTLRYAENKDLGILDGVPIAVMDEIDVAGYKKTLGSKFDFSSKEDATATCVYDLEARGAINMGKLSMHELGLDVG